MDGDDDADTDADAGRANKRGITPVRLKYLYISDELSGLVALIMSHSTIFQLYL